MTGAGNIAGFTELPGHQALPEDSYCRTFGQTEQVALDIGAPLGPGTLVGLKIAAGIFLQTGSLIDSFMVALSDTLVTVFPGVSQKKPFPGCDQGNTIIR